MKTSECSDMMPSVLKNYSCSVLVLPNTIKIAVTRLYAVTDPKEFRALSVLPVSDIVVLKGWWRGGQGNTVAFL